ncbi:MAG: tyrosine-type recombinase/integrase [Candidatus Binataceae bacterium]
MAGRLTDRAAQAARGRKEGQFLIRDADVRGFALRVTPNGSKAWVWDGRIHRQMRRITIGQYPDLNVAEARAEALRIRHDIAIGLDPARKREEARKELTLKDLASQYLDNYARSHKRSWEQDDHRIRLHFKVLAGCKLSEISRETASVWHRRIGERRGLYQANRCLALLSAIYGWAIRLDYWQGQNPAKGIAHFREESRSRYLNAEELARLWDALDTEHSPYWPAYFKLALLLGMRKNELLQARWEDVNLRERLWCLPITKAKRPHLLPIPQAALEILQALPSHNSSQWLFPGKTRPDRPLADAEDAWERIRARANLSDVRIHDLRRTLGSWLATQGYSLTLIGKALNHTNVSTTAVYARLHLEPLREALEKNATLMLTQLHPVSSKR